MEAILPIISFVVGAGLAWIIKNQLDKRSLVNKDKYDEILKEKEISDYKIQALNEEIIKSENEKKEIKQDLRLYTEENTNIKSQLSSSKTLLEEKTREIEEFKVEILDFTNDISEIKQKFDESEKQNINLSENNKYLLEKLESQKEEIKNIGEKFSNEFKVLANNILDEKSKKFTEQNQMNLKTLLDPLGENIKEFKKKVEETYDKESKQRFSLESKIKELAELNIKISDEANNLTQALKGSTKTQGDWGEMILETILENSGLEKGREFFVQEFLRDDAGKTIKDSQGHKLQPDVLVKYPDGRNVIIDSKVSLIAYERFVSSEDDLLKEKELKNHIQSLKSHIDGLSSKNYDQFTESLDFVMLFVPIEPAYILAMKHDNNLWNYAYNKKILLISPTNLIAALKLVADLWKREHQNRNAFEIAERGGRLYDKFVSFAESLVDVGGNIGKAQKSYDKALNQLRDGKGDIITQVEKLKELGVKAQKSIPISLKKDD